MSDPCGDATPADPAYGEILPPAAGSRPDTRAARACLISTLKRQKDLARHTEVVRETVQ